MARASKRRRPSDSDEASALPLESRRREKLSVEHGQQQRDRARCDHDHCDHVQAVIGDVIVEDDAHDRRGGDRSDVGGGSHEPRCPTY